MNALALAATLLLALPVAAQHKPAATAKAPELCSLLTPDQIKPLAGAAVLTGKPGANACTWSDAKGEIRVYISVGDALDFHNMRAQMAQSGHLTALPGVAEDAFYVASAGSSAPLYLLKKTHFILLTVTGPNFSRADNEAAEKALAPMILPKL